MLEVKNLHVNSSDGEVLKGVNLKVEKGEIQVILGPNAGGKSTLAKTISGSPDYKITRGNIIFNGKEIKSKKPEERVKEGIAMSFQSPPQIPGLKLSTLIKKMPIKKRVKENNLLEREVNSKLSGGEKKMSELFQILSLDPKLSIFDEIDSGLDIKRVKKTANTIKKNFISKEKAVLVITHSGNILHFLEPDKVNVMIDGKIVCKNKNYKKVLDTIEKYGYEKCRECQFSSS